MIEKLSLPLDQFFVLLTTSYSGFSISTHRHTQLNVPQRYLTMIPKLILQAYPLPLGSVKIGSLITDPLHPNEDIQNGSTSLSLETDCSVSRTGPRLESINDSSNTSIVFKLLSQLFGHLQNSASSSQKIVADDTCTYELNNPNNRFKDLTSQKEVQS